MMTRGKTRAATHSVPEEEEISHSQEELTTLGESNRRNSSSSVQENAVSVSPTIEDKARPLSPINVEGAVGAL